MGSIVSSGKDNNELVDNLMEARYIKTKEVERVFRAVDRGDYILPSHRESAYKDLAWKHGHIHLSAPCVYSAVMEGLHLKPGMSFLNLGSGTGYLSTMAGLILNRHGTNHGIELDPDCLKYAYDRLEVFKQKSLALDEFDFCEPVFIQGNCLNVVPGRQYDRVYCGASCPESHEQFIKQFVRIGGILVMPFKDQLLLLHRADEHDFVQYELLPVCFETLVIPRPEDNTLFHLPECDALSLQELCRGQIRHHLRQRVWHDHSEVEIKKPIEPTDLHDFNYETDESLSDDGEEFIPRSMFFHLNVGFDQRQNKTNISINGKSLKKMFSDISDSDSDIEQEETLIQRTKVAKREKTDSGIAEDVSLSNEDGNVSSNTNRTNSETVSPAESVDEMDVDLSDIRLRSNYNSPSGDNTPAEGYIGHYVDSIAFTTYMKEKIHQLPLPFPLKLYINYNREL